MAPMMMRRVDTKSVLDRVEERKCEFKRGLNKLMNLRWVMGNFVGFKSDLDTKVDEVFDNFVEELHAAWRDGSLPPDTCTIGTQTLAEDVILDGDDQLDLSEHTVPCNQSPNSQEGIPLLENQFLPTSFCTTSSATSSTTSSATEPINSESSASSVNVILPLETIQTNTNGMPNLCETLSLQQQSTPLTTTIVPVDFDSMECDDNSREDSNLQTTEYSTQNSSRTPDATTTNELSTKKIKRRVTAFLVYYQSELPKIKAQQPDIHSRAVAIQLGKRWHILSDEERKPFFDEAERLKLLHKKEHPDYDFQSTMKKKVKLDSSEIKFKIYDKEAQLTPSKKRKRTKRKLTEDDDDNSQLNLSDHAFSYPCVIPGLQQQHQSSEVNQDEDEVDGLLEDSEVMKVNEALNGGQMDGDISSFTSEVVGNDEKLIVEGQVVGDVDHEDNGNGVNQLNGLGHVKKLEHVKNLEQSNIDGPETAKKVDQPPIPNASQHVFKCPYESCSATFVQEKNLIKHLNMYTPELFDRAWKAEQLKPVCKLCFEYFNSMNELRKHIRTVHK